nr:hypothetical protein [Tanacetum cinerariifolium]
MHSKHTESTAPAKQLPAPAASQSYSYSNLEHDTCEPNALPELNVLPGAPLPPAEWLKGLRRIVDGPRRHRSPQRPRQADRRLDSPEHPDHGRSGGRDQPLQPGTDSESPACRHSNPCQPVLAHGPGAAMGPPSQPQPHSFAKTQCAAGLQPCLGEKSVSMHKQADKTPVPRYKPYKGPAGGWGALISVTQAWLTSDNALKNLRMMLKTNQNGGFDCPGCAWGDSPESGMVKFCENG